MKVLLLSRYDYLGASTRVRSFQYIPYLNKKNIKVAIKPLLSNEYIKNLYRNGKKLPVIVLLSYLKRLIFLLNIKRYNLLWIEKELFPMMPAWIEELFAILKIPYIVDYDDAIFHNYDLNKNVVIRTFLKNKIDSVMKNSAMVIVGNDYLAERSRKAGAKRVEYLPSVVDLEKYPNTFFSNKGIFTIGWVGSPITSHYLKLVMPALEDFCKKNVARVVLIGAKKKELSNIPVEYVSWSEGTEIKEIQKFDIGIMPLPDNEWERGKCGFKLIQYMASGKPVIGSPVGVNCKIIKHGINGYQAKNIDEWIRALQKLKDDQALRQKMGRAGRQIVENEYCLQVTAPRLRDLIISVAKELKGKE